MHLAAVVLNYETPDDTARAVQSLERSRRRPDAVIVVDNGSRDGSPGRLAALAPGARIVGTTENLGFSAGNNLGIRDAVARGADAILLVNSDATLAPDCLDRLERAMSTRPEIGIAGPVVVSADDQNRVLSAGIAFSSWTGRMRELGFDLPRHARELSGQRTVDAVSGCAMLVRRKVFERVGLLDEDYFFSFEDLDLCLRARGAGFVTVCVGDATATHAGSRSIGRTSPSRLYFATRNHLRVARRFGTPQGGGAQFARAAAVVALNLTYAISRSGTPATAAVASVLRGARDHAAGRYGAFRR